MSHKLRNVPFLCLPLLSEILFHLIWLWDLTKFCLINKGVLLHIKWQNTPSHIGYHFKQYQYHKQHQLNYCIIGFFNKNLFILERMQCVNLWIAYSLCAWEKEQMKEQRCFTIRGCCCFISCWVVLHIPRPHSATEPQEVSGGKDEPMRWFTSLQIEKLLHLHEVAFVGAVW